MSTVAAVDQAHSYLIDVRLDSLDRILMDNGVSRSERIEIVQAVEDQIHEMLAQQGDEITRDSVLQVLRSLDPPEAYCNDEVGYDTGERPSRSRQREMFADTSNHSGRMAQPTATKVSGIAITSFVLALCSIPTWIIMPLGSTLAFVGFIFACIALPMISASQGRIRGSWMAFVACGIFAMHFLAAWVLIFSM